MGLHQAAVDPTCRLQVNINCCTMCQLKAKEKLQKIKGVESIVCDSKGVVTVSGKVNPMALVKKLEKWGKKAELLSFQKSPKQDDARGPPGSTNKGSNNSVQGTPTSSNKGGDSSVHNGTHPKVDKDSCCNSDAMPGSDDVRGPTNKGSDNSVQNNGSHPSLDKDSCCRCDAVSDSDSDYDSDLHDHNYDHDNDCNAPAAKNEIQDPNIIWQNPDPLTIINKQTKKSSYWKTFLGLFCKKKKLAARRSAATMLGKPSTKDGPSKWQLPRMHAPEYGGGSKPYHQQRPFDPYPPPVMGRPSAPPYDPYGYMRPVPPHPPVVPPYGFFNSRPPPKINPMIHYTSYADNYSFW